MRTFKILSLLFVTLFLNNCKNSSNADVVSIEQHSDSNGFKYETVTNDPTGLRLYTLDNGLKVYLGKNEEEPKIQTLIGVRAGSSYDPADNTGLAHYLEHMVFKGTDEIGALDFEAEHKILKQISDLYEKHKAESDPDKKKEIYKEIDKLSYEASKLCVANEYDKLTTMLGAEGTNAFTSNEQTVYVNKIPSNELDKWLKVEGERFSQLVLRLFHTELEAVYEEFNMGQDSDRRKQYYTMLEGVFPTHPYGTQTTIGKGEHLKNPSMEAIHAYFDKYYVPNNMAVVLVGDLDFDTTIQKVNDAFGSYERKDVVHPELPKEAPITSPIKKEVFGPTAESIFVAFRTDGYGTKEAMLVKLVDYILANSQAGLMDLNLNQKQAVQYGSSFTSFNNDYGMHVLIGMPKAGQSLDDVRDLLLAEIENVKSGNFDDWIIDAVINDLKLSRTKSFGDASSTAYEYLDAFIHFADWKDRLTIFDEMKKVTKQDIIDFANKHYANNYVEVHKLKGEDKNTMKVKNPGITPIELNRDKESSFLSAFKKIESPKIEPQYIDYSTAIKTSNTANGLEVSYIENNTNDLFDLNVIFDLGKDHDKLLPIAAGYFDYLGTDQLSPEDVKKEFYKLGIEYSISSSSDKTYIGLSGLKENLDAGLVLLENLWENAVPNQEAYNKYVDKIIKGREDGKVEKGNILWNGLFNYGMYGENSRLRNILNLEELKAINPQDLVNKIKGLKNYKQRIFYYGKEIDNAIAAIDKNHKLNNALSDYPSKTNYIQKDTGGSVYFVDYDMVQSEIIFLAKGSEFDPAKLAASNLFNTYFGSGLSSIVFQEIRESKSLAYSAFSSYSNASEKDKHNYVYAYIGTQVNKMPQAIDAMLDLMTNMPEAQEMFNQAKEATLKQIAAERITKSDIFWTYEGLKKRGITEDNRKEMYNTIKDMSLADLKMFFNENIKGQSYNVLVIGNKKDVNFKELSKLGEVKELDVDYLFNYEKPKALKL
ncbi:M16 family metallopeptidase [Seonamhaeicola marinus]|uniref:Insulinase family protein n=1 Tax=Seonamhaeicola marinus TaxID=1912246 RepID=A0A5D0HNE6_9FLAO|nr:M16 family metallopeptidase [Seonamhaeicola marinus]TYA71899.1 insulinase family protein [Seonamhaeicola marinus]